MKRISDIKFIQPKFSSKLYSKADSVELLDLLKTYQARIFGARAHSADEKGQIHDVDYDIIFYPEEHDFTYFRSDEVYLKMQKFVEDGKNNYYYFFNYDANPKHKDIPFIMRGMTPIFTKSNALKLLECLRKDQAKFYGIDGFIIRPKHHEPKQDYSIDVDAAPYRLHDYASPEMYDLALEFLKKQPSGPENWYEVMYKDVNDYSP